VEKRPGKILSVISVVDEIFYTVADETTEPSNTTSHN